MDAELKLAALDQHWSQASYNYINEEIYCQNFQEALILKLQKGSLQRQWNREEVYICK